MELPVVIPWDWNKLLKGEEIPIKVQNIPAFTTTAWEPALETQTSKLLIMNMYLPRWTLSYRGILLYQTEKGHPSNWFHHCYPFVQWDLWRTCTRCGMASIPLPTYNLQFLHSCQCRVNLCRSQRLVFSSSIVLTFFNISHLPIICLGKTFVFAPVIFFCE